MRPALQVLLASGGEGAQCPALSPWQRAALRRAGVDDGELVDSNWPFPERPVPWRHRPLWRESLGNGIRWLRPVSSLERRRVRAAIGRAERSLIVTTSEGLDLLDRCALPVELLERCSIVAVGPVWRTLALGRRPAVGARLRLVVPERDARVVMPLVGRVPGLDGVDRVPGSHRHVLGRPETAVIIRAELERVRAAGEQDLARRADPRPRRPRIDLVAPPYAGHLHPTLGIALELQRQGADVRLLTSGDGALGSAQAAGVPAVGLVPELSDAIDAHSRTVIGSAPLKMRALAHLQSFRGAMEIEAAMARQLAELWDEESPDALVADFAIPIAGHEAQRRGIPWITSCPSPSVLDTPDAPPIYLGGLGPLPGRVGRLRDGAGRLLILAVKQGAALAARRMLEPYGVRRPHRADGTEIAYSPRRILALGLRELELSGRFAWPVRFTGPIVGPPAALADRLAVVTVASDRPVIVLTLGTHLDGEKRRLAQIVEELLRRAPAAEIWCGLGGGDAGRRELELLAEREPRLQVRRLLDYRQLGGAALIVHHGGAGIAWAATSSGARQLVWPVDHDQPDIAVRLERAGLAVRADRFDAIAAAAARELERADRPGEREHRARWARRVRSRDGAAAAARQVLADLERWRPGAGLEGASAR